MFGGVYAKYKNKGCLHRICLNTKVGSVQCTLYNEPAIYNLYKCLVLLIDWLIPNIINYFDWESVECRYLDGGLINNLDIKLLHWLIDLRMDGFSCVIDWLIDWLITL